MRNPSVSALLPVSALLLCVLGGVAFAQDAPPAVPAPDAAVAPAGAIQIALPFNKAIVREIVPIKLRDFPDGGYAEISLDGQFITAQALPRRQTDPVFLWDTKAAKVGVTADDPSRFYGDGAHAITIAVYDVQSKFVGKDTVQVQVANKINMASGQGIKLSYPWSLNTRLTYQRRTVLTATPADAPQTEEGRKIQESLLRYRRTVENVSGGTFLVRDEALTVDKSAHPKPFASYVSTHDLPQALQNVSAVRPSYRVVDARGRVLSHVGEANGGEQLAFSIPVLPPRRVSVGAHWDTPVQMTLDWTSPYPATVTATSTLEDFEWQDRYPTAKIRETYVGPATFQPRPGSPLPLLQTQAVKFERLIYFAYNAGRIVRMETTLSLTSTAPGLLSGGAGPGGSNPYGGGQPGGMPGGNYPGGMPGGYPDGMSGGTPPGNYPGSSGNSNRRRGGSPNSNYPGGNYPGGAGGAVESGPVVLKYIETSVIIL